MFRYCLVGPSIFLIKKIKDARGEVIPVNRAVSSGINTTYRWNSETLHLSKFTYKNICH